ncbi:conserved hypothetical protein [Histoplasma mississippiense (nom. inval.)]|uniref:conserved hypothetical protein n=1 Tax=Ajellomyces capsulatus (strain NAm1 / WU24) TaxID=2059318 RepID=UPI000157CE3A|nr:conserved hypothetical protein [Histoplasma mississippiense (nom. inval.)]EDN10682.1 conserved hypothetical protein [Histoplasma mississippiense (nom. inval.)]
MADVDSLAQNRRRGRDEGRDASHAGHDQHDSGEPSHSQSDSIKKRKRTRKGDSEKKFECKHEGCGKSYSRAEHLYRHQLNPNTLAAVAPQVRNAFPTGNGTNITCSPTDDSISPYPKQIPSENASGNMSRPRLPASSSAPNGGPTNGQNYSHSSAVRSAGSSSSTSIENHLQLLTPQQQYAVPNPRLKRSDSSSSYTLSPQKQSTSISPFAMTDDFTAWLFNEHSNNNSPIAYPNAPGMVPNYADQASAQLQGPYYPSDAALTSYFTNVVQPQHPMSVTSLLDSGPPQSIMSDEKRNELLELIQSRFNETNQAAMKTRKDALLDGDIDDDGHLLSLRMMQTYIAAYWYHTHDQLPILHKPTFSADKTPNLLLLAIMAIGASTLDKNHGHHVTEAASELGQLFSLAHPVGDFYGRGFPATCKALGVPDVATPRNLREAVFNTGFARTCSYPSRYHINLDAARKSTTGSGTNSASESGAEWRLQPSSWIQHTPRCLDIPRKWLPMRCVFRCPATKHCGQQRALQKSQEYNQSLHSNGAKAIMFPMLKKTLNGQKSTNKFIWPDYFNGWFTSVSWHMNQRDLQVSSLGVAQALGGRDRWRSSLLRSYDNWKRDFDDALESNPSNYSSAFRQYSVDDDVIFESRTVLHHLAHMASHVDVVDCQIFAGAGRLLGRSITPKDYSTTREKMTERWANKAAARDAAFFAVKFLTQVLISEDGRTVIQHGSAGYLDLNEYSARDDFLLNRPWVIYFASLVVWSYGYALDGPISAPVPELSTPDERRRDMHEFLDRVGGVRTPEELLHIRGRNRCMGLLMTLQESFSYTRWELLHEAANLMGSCIEKLKGSGAQTNTSS